MELAIVLGQVVSTVKHAGFEQQRLLLVDFIDPEGQRKGSPCVATDSIGAGDGEWVLVVQGSSARKTISNDAPTDLSVVGIVDEVVLGGKLTFHKWAGRNTNEAAPPAWRRGMDENGSARWIST